MIPYKDGLSILENLEDADGKLTMTIKKGVRFSLKLYSLLLGIYDIKSHEVYMFHKIHLS